MLSFTQISSSTYIAPVGYGVLTVTHSGGNEYTVGFYSPDLSVKRVQCFDSLEEAQRYAQTLIISTLKAELMELELNGQF